MAPAIVALRPEHLELTDESAQPLGRGVLPVIPAIGPLAPTVYLDRKSPGR